MAHAHTHNVSRISASNLLADVFLARIPEADRNLAVRDIAAQLQDSNLKDAATAELVASLVQKCPDDEAEQYLINFLSRALRNGEYKSAAEVCLPYPAVRKFMLQTAEDQIKKTVSSFLRRPAATGFIVPSAYLAEALPALSSKHGVRDNLDGEMQICRHYLGFLKHLFWLVKRQHEVAASVDLQQYLLLAVLSVNEDFSAAAKDTLFALFGASISEQLVPFFDGFTETPPNGAALDGLMWHLIRGMLVVDASPAYKTTAYAIWLRWLDLPGARKSFQEAMSTDDYWDCLRSALVDGDTEQRKMSLHILRRSLAESSQNIHTEDMDIDVKNDEKDKFPTQAEWDRYCIVFETIVLGRYVNQVEECLGDLDALASPSSTIPRSWFYALLAPAVSPDMQDSIRKLIGNWFLDSDPKPDKQPWHLAGILRLSFLPWAVQGHMFTASLQGDTREMHCEHGKRLSAFVERLVQNHASQADIDARRGIVAAILDFLISSGNRIMPLAVCYLLQGLVNGLQAEETPCLGATELGMILDLANASGYPEAARDVHQVRCWQLCQLCDGMSSEGYYPSASATDSAYSPEVIRTKFASLSERVQKLRQGGDRTDGGSSEGQRWISLQHLLSDLVKTRHSCLQGQGLMDAAQSLLHVLDKSDGLDIDPSTLHTALDAIWTELEVQEYPKRATMLMPGLMFHRICAIKSEHDSVCDFLLSRLADFRTLIKGRIYVFPPLMAAIRSAVFAVPEFAQRLPLPELITEIADKPPVPKIDFLLEAAAASLLSSVGPDYHHLTYQRYYGDQESFGYAAYFDMVNRLGLVNQHLANQLLDLILKRWSAQKPPVPSVVRWKTTEQLQVTLLLSEQLLSKSTAAEAHDHFKRISHILGMEPLPRYRVLLEWMIARTMILHPQVAQEALNMLSTRDHHSNPKFLASLVKVATMVACLEQTNENFAIQVGTYLIALSASSKIIVRHEAQWSFPILWDHAVKQNWTGLTTNPAFASLNDYIRSLERSMVPPPSRLLERLDPVKDNDLAHLLQGGYLQLEPPGQVMVTAADFEALWKRDSATLPSGCLPLGSVPSTPSASSTGTSAKPPPPTRTKSAQATTPAAPTALQTKGTAYLASTLSRTTRTHTSGADLIVVASLVDNAYNLGGLSRISEIFGASALYMSTTSVLSNKDFVSVAVASQNHIPIHALPLTDLAAFLTDKKSEGYAVVGVEQTDRSVLLGTEGPRGRLPRKTVLVMGAEKEGISAEVLGECDVLVEVPQRGVTRSMNVQTAAGVVLFEWVRQHGANNLAAGLGVGDY